MSTSGPNSSVSASNLDTGSPDWATPTNVYSSDDAYSTNVVAAQFTDYLLATQFGFAIAADQVIVGIVVEVEGKVSTGTLVCRVELAGLAGGDATHVATFTTTEAYKTYGSSTDMWSNSVITPANVNAGGFGIYFYANTTYTGTISIDHVRITIHHINGGVILPKRSTAAVKRAAYH